MQTFFEHAQHATGALAEFAGVYTPGMCGGFIFPSVQKAEELSWSEGNMLHKVDVRSATEVFGLITFSGEITFNSDKEPWRGAGKVQIYKVVWQGLNFAGEDLLGFKGSHLFYSKDGTQSAPDASHTWSFFLSAVRSNHSGPTSCISWRQRTQGHRFRHGCNELSPPTFQALKRDINLSPDYNERNKIAHLMLDHDPHSPPGVSPPDDGTPRYCGCSVPTCRLTRKSGRPAA